MTPLKSMLLSATALLTLTAHAATVSTGDLGANVITAGGSYTWSPTISAPSTALPATLDVKYGLWNDPDVLVHAFVNGTEVGSFLVHNGYYTPGPSSNTFTVTGLLVDGVNTVTFDGLGASAGDYVIGSIDLNYNLPSGETNNVPDDTGDTNSVPVTRRGSSVLHYLTRSPLATTDAGSNATASLRLQLNEQGHASLQKFDLEATGLQPNTKHFLSAVTGDDTNALSVGSSDRHGRLRLSFTKKGQGRGSPKKALPDELNPIPEIRGIGLLDMNAQTLAFAWVNASPDYQYLVKRNLTKADANATPAGSISLKANASSVHFRLLANGLSVSKTYYLALNSEVVATLTADDEGAVKVDAWPARAPAVLDLRTLSLLDASSNAVLRTTLPK